MLRNKTPALIVEEFYGLMMAHFAIRGRMHEAALKADLEPDTLSFPTVVSVVHRKLPTFHSIPPGAVKRFHQAILDEIFDERVVSSRRNKRSVKRKMSNHPIRRGTDTGRIWKRVDDIITILSQPYWGKKTGKEA